MTSPNLAAPHVAAAQNQKEVTINDATDALDLAMTATLDVDCSAAGTITVSAGQMQRHVRIRLTGTPAATFIVELHATPRLCAVANDTGQTATVRTDAGTGIDVGPDAQVLVHVSTASVSLVGAPPVASGTEAYDFGMVALETPVADAVLGKVVLPRAVTLAGDFAGARGHVDTAPAANFVMTVTVNGLEVGTATIGTDGAVVFATTGGAAVALAAEDVIRFVAPGTADASIAGIALTLQGSLA